MAEETKTVKAADMSVEQLKALAYDEQKQIDLHRSNLQAIEAEIIGRMRAKPKTPSPVAQPNRASRRAVKKKVAKKK